MINALPAFRVANIAGTTKTELTIRVFADEQYIIGSKNIVSESMKITQAICDDSDIRFGGCIAGSFEIEISKNVDLTGKYITVTAKQTSTAPTYPGAHLFSGMPTYPGGTQFEESFDVFSGEVFSCKHVKNGLTRRLIAYDRFYWRGSMDCTAVYKTAFGNSTKTTLGNLRQALLTHFRIRQQAIIDITPEGGEYDYTAPVPLSADDFDIYKMDVDELTLNDALRMIGEFSGVFMWLNGSGNLEYITLPSENDAADDTYDFYIDADAEPFTVESFDGFKIPALGDFSFDSSLDVARPYLLDDNPLITYGYTSPNFQSEYNSVKSAIKQNFNFLYRPASIKAQSRLWLQLGDKVKFSLKWYTLNDDDTASSHEEDVYMVILSRTISGIQALTDELEAQGECTSTTLEEESQQ